MDVRDQRVPNRRHEAVCFTEDDNVEGGTKERQVDDLSRAVLKGRVRNRTYLRAKGITKKRRSH